jgi:hypothetical protein
VTSSVTKTNGYNVKRIVDLEFLSAKQIADTIASGDNFQVEDVLVNGANLELNIVETTDEVAIAENLHQELLGIRQAAPWLLRDHGFWSWLALYPLREHVVSRWCDGYDGRRPKKETGCAYFISGDSVHGQARCASRRLYIAADTSKRADNNYSHVGLILKTSDKFSTVFERKLGLDAELAVEMFLQFESTGADRKTYRTATKLLGLILGTVCLEDLDRHDKKKLVSEALQEVSQTLIDGD